MAASRKLNLKNVPPPAERVSGKEDPNALPDVAVTFMLPGNKKRDHKAKTGHTVEMLKALLADELQVPFGDLTLSYQNKPMLDPLSLNDIAPSAQAMTIQIKPANHGSSLLGL